MPDNLDPLRHIEGFPLGEDEDLHALSDPPHYTAYPNPHLAGFIEKYGAPYDEASDDYHCEPYVSDVSEGKSDPIYQAHPYHTKVPYKAISKFIEHYTEPEEIVLDAFCGSGMTGIAAQITGRRAILSDLSPVATYIASCYNHPINQVDFVTKAKEILTAVQKECGWMYETRHTDGQKGRINFTVWSDIHQCPYCQTEHILWDLTVDVNAKTVSDKFQCSECGADVTKKSMPKIYKDSGEAKTVPVLISYFVGKKRFEKTPDDFDMQLLARIEQSEIPYWYPTEKMMFIGERWGDMYVPLHHTGISRVDQFYTKRNLWALTVLFHQIGVASGDDIQLRNALLMLFTSVCIGLTSKLTRYNFGNRGNGYLSGTLYVPSYIAETRVDKVLQSKIRDLTRIHQTSKHQLTYVTTQSSTDLSNIPANSIDYIFVDPPFGRNLMYSELNFIWEAWLRVFTRNQAEAIVNKSQGKHLSEYRGLMYRCFVEMYRVLKSNRWITVEFHNSKAAVWTAIQDSLARAGFVVAQVAVLDKKQGSYKQVIETGAVKNDLVINAYKPRISFTQQFTSQAGRDLEAEFVRQHLEQLPKTANIERTKEMLYSKYLAYYVQHGYQVAYNGEQFYRALPQWGLIEQDGYWFGDETHLQTYQQALAAAEEETNPQPPLFIFDERSAIQWLKHFLHHNPATMSGIQPDYLKTLQTSTDLIPDLRDLLAENFGQPDRRGRYHWPHPQFQTELDEARHNRLLRLYDDYLSQARAGQRLKEIRKEALVTGFTEAYRAGRFRDILTVGHKLHKRLLEDNPDLFDFVDIAEAKVEG